MHKSVREELNRTTGDSETTKEDEALWPHPDQGDQQELKSSLEMNTFLSQHQKLGPLLMSITPRTRVLLFFGFF